MKNNLLMEFSADKANKKIHVKREFAAPVPIVWDAWTKPEILDQWWAPKPWQAKTKSMDFTEGGRWLYAMVSPEGEEHWSFADYKKITPQKSYEGIDGFCDPQGNINPDMPQTYWTVAFEQASGHTIVNITCSYQALEDLEKILAMGFQEGFTMGLGNLDELLAK